MDSHPDNHHALKRTYAGLPRPKIQQLHHGRDESFYQHRADKDDVGLGSKTFPCPESVPRSRYLTENQLRVMFEGINADNAELIDNICMHKEVETYPAQNRLSMHFDIDSWIVVTKRLDAIRRDLELNLTYRINNQINSNLHVQVTLTNGKSINIHDTLHMPVAEISSELGGTLYICLPSLVSECRDEDAKDGKKNLLTLSQRNRLLDRILIPAMLEVAPSPVRQYIHHVAREVDGKAKAQSQEHGSGGQARQRPNIVRFRAEQLGDLQRAIRRELNKPQNYDFQDAFFVINQLGRKNDYRTPTLLEAWHSFTDRFEQQFDTTRTKHIWVKVLSLKSSPMYIRVHLWPTTDM